MTNPSVRNRKSGDQLAVGDWLAPEEVADGPAEVLFAYAYPASADKGKHVQLVVHELGKTIPQTEIIGGNNLFDLASDEDLAGYRQVADRARFASGLREFADWIEANPSVPIGWDGCGYQQARVQVDLHGENEDATAETIARVREIADRLGVKVHELDDRTDASMTVGAVSYSVIAWHRGGRPAEPAKPLISDETIAEAAAMEERDRAAGGPPWEVPEHPENAQPGGWHHGQIR